MRVAFLGLAPPDEMAGSRYSSMSGHDMVYVMSLPTSKYVVVVFREFPAPMGDCLIRFNNDIGLHYSAFASEHKRPFGPTVQGIIHMSVSGCAGKIEAW